MAKTELLQSRYTRMVKDIPRHLLPPNSLWSLSGGLPNNDGPIRKMGGWLYASTIFQSYFSPFAWAPFSTPQLVAGVGYVTTFPVTTIHAELWKITSATTSTLIQEYTNNTTFNASAPPVFFNGELIISGQPNLRYNGTTVSVFDATELPPTNSVFAVHKSRLVCAAGTPGFTFTIPPGSTGHPLPSATAVQNPVRFSAPLDADTYDVFAFIEPTYPVIGMASLGNTLLLFSRGHVEAIRGSTPPQTDNDGGDMRLDGLFDEGCLSPFTISVRENRVVWASERGVFLSDGASIDDLAKLGGMSLEWRRLTSSLVSTNRTAAGGIHNGYYFLTFGQTEQDRVSYAINLDTKAWQIIPWLRARSYTSTFGTPTPEMYFTEPVRNPAAGTNPGYAGTLSGIFAPSTANMTNGDGLVSTLEVETPFYRGNPGSRRWKDIYLGVNFFAPAGSWISVAYKTDADDQTYTDAVNAQGSQFQILVTNGYERVKVPIDVAAPGLGLRITQHGPAIDYRLHDIEAVVHEREMSR